MAVAKAMPDDCTHSMAAQISKTRAESEAFLKKDSLDSKCGRFKCGDKGKCFIYRRKLHNEGKSLYSIVKCKAETGKTPKKSESAAEGADKDSTPLTPAAAHSVTVPTGNFSLATVP